MKKMLSLFLPFLICTLLACSTYTDKEKNTFDHQIQKYVRGNQLHCQRSSSGLYYSISDPGSGPTVQYTDSVRFVYSGRLLNGSLFDIQKKTVTFKVRDLIAGWKEIMLQLKPGAKVFQSWCLIWKSRKLFKTNSLPLYR
jgi:FKBP-type peptidyl-prolyl cis-trans isomerase